MFNLRKHSQADFANAVMDAAEAEKAAIDNPAEEPLSPEAIEKSNKADGTEGLYEEYTKAELMDFLDLLGTDPKNEIAVEKIKTRLRDHTLVGDYPDKYDESGRTNIENRALELDQFDLMKSKASQDKAMQAAKRLIQQEIQTLNKNELQGAGMAEVGRKQELGLAFNLQKHKTAQMEEQTRFPVANPADFVEKFVDDLLAYNNMPGTEDYERSRIAFEEIENTVSPGFEEEVNSALEAITQLEPRTERDKASKYLMRIYEVLLPPAFKEQGSNEQEVQPMQPTMQPMEPVMSKKTPDGIVKFNLDDHILNNKTMTKTAADQFGQQYLLYGPTEKRICPKLRGKNMSVGDVVSEYICRHHCLDGLVIDDNKTICGEALWRANSMDKFSREYVNADGEIEGGYLNKRFEVNRNVDEENRMRLKPGETRKPRPASQGNLEARMQDMRAKEGKKRGYKPDVNTGDSFDWCQDQDQNNVEVSQKERDRREKAMGHQLVQYTEKEQQENTKQTKTASTESICGRCGEKFDGIGYECPDCKKDEGKNEDKKAFNLKKYKVSQTNFTGGPMPHRTFEEMGKEFSPEGQYNHCGVCKKRTPTNDLIGEDNGSGGSVSVCPECRQNKTAQTNNHKIAELPQPRVQGGFSEERGVLQDPTRRKTKEHQYDEHITPVNVSQTDAAKPTDAKMMPKSLGISSQIIEELKQTINEYKTLPSPVFLNKIEELRKEYSDMKSDTEAALDIIRTEMSAELSREGVLLSDGKFNLKHFKQAKENNPWSICNSKINKDENPEKWERCVKKVKNKSLDEKEAMSSNDIQESKKKS